MKNASYNDDHHKPFEFSDDAFNKRMDWIYNDYVKDMFLPHRYDTGIISWEVNGKDQIYSVSRFSDAAVKEDLRQLAPFNLVDGAWLQNILSTGPCDEVQARLFSIWEDEAGNGRTELNHCNVYDTLLKSLNIYMPSIKSSEFIEQDFLPSAFIGPVFQLCVGLFPEEMFPELLGMTLYLEWEATPTLTPKVRMLAGRRMDPHFYRLHVAIDNVTSGHGALAKEAIKLYLNRQNQDGGKQAVEDHWKRIWNGYVTWATLGGLGKDLLERLMAMDRKQINIGDPSHPKCFPDLKTYYHQRMVSLIKSKAPRARQVHQGRTVAGKALNSLFDKPDEVMQALVDAKYVDPEHSRSSKFFDLLSFSGPMYKVFTEDHKGIILDWIESLRAATASCVDPITMPVTPTGSADKMANVIHTHAIEAKSAHSGIMLANAEGKPVALVSLFDNPSALMQALVRCGWIVPNDPDRTRPAHIKPLEK